MTSTEDYMMRLDFHNMTENQQRVVVVSGVLDEWL